jgi:protein-disulfide isomerase
MQIARRSLLSLVTASAFAPAAFADDTADSGADSPYAQRSIGSPDAKVTAYEYFSLTCTHCAYFGVAVMPQVKPKLVDTGILQIIYKDCPLDQIALMAAQVARSLPAEQYYPYIEALFASQSDWAFNPANGDSKDALFKYAVLAGMDRDSFDAAIANQKLQQFVLDSRSEAMTIHHIDATPTFIINGTNYPGALEYDDFYTLIMKNGG